MPFSVPAKYTRKMLKDTGMRVSKCAPDALSGASAAYVYAVLKNAIARTKALKKKRIVASALYAQ